MDSKKLKGLGLLAAILGLGVNVLSDWVDEQNLDAKIDEKVNKAIEQKGGEEES